MGKLGMKRRKRAQAEATTVMTLSNLWCASPTHICGICGEIIASQDGASVDHIVPLADGGRETFENVRLAHRSCNSTRHAERMYREQAEVRLRWGDADAIPHTSARKKSLWRRHEPNICPVCGDVITVCRTAVLRYRVPLDQGGTDTKDNLELTHPYCSTGVITEQK